MIRSAVALLLLAAATSSAAPPAGWKLDESLSLDLTRKAQRDSYFGGTPTTKISVEAFIAPGGGSLFVTRAEASPPADRRDRVASRALAELANNANRQGSAELETTWKSMEPTTKQLEAKLTWLDPVAGIRQVGRTVVAADAAHVVAITGECMMPSTPAPEIEQTCKASLATLDPGIPLDQRVTLAIVAVPPDSYDAPVATEPAPTPTPTTTAPSRMTEQPRLGDGARTPMAPMTIRQAKREVDRRPIYLGGGIIVLAALFWWNRRHRDRFDREERSTTATTTEPEPSSGDDDADDLQAAARGPAPKDES